MKKSLIFCALGLAAVAASVAAGANGSVGAKAEAVTNTAESWTKNAGGQTCTTTENGVKFENFGGYTATSRLTNKVKLDGLSFKIYGDGNINKQNSVYGFYFDGAEEGQPSAINCAPVWSIWEGMYGSQVRWQIGATYDRDSESRTYSSTDATAYTGLTGVPAGVSTWNSTGFNGYEVSFEKVNSTWYKMVISDCFNQIWYAQSGVVLEGGNSTEKTCTRYFKASEIANLDEDGQAYLYVYGAAMADGVDTPTFYVENLTSNPQYQEGDAIDVAKEQAIQDITDAVLALDQDNYKAVDWASAMTTVNQAKASVNAATTTEDIDAAVSQVNTTLEALEPMEISTTGWTVVNGDSSQLSVKTTEENVRASNLHAYSAEVVKDEKVVLNGLEMTFGGTGKLGNSALGFFFGQTKAKGYSGAVFTIWRKLYGTQTRLHIGVDHNHNSSSIARQSNSDEAEVGFGVAGSAVFNAADSFDRIHVKFEHMSRLWWKVTVSEVEGSMTMWGNNANYQKVDGKGTFVTYLPSSYLPVDENGATYLHVYGASDAGGAAIIKDFVNGELKEITEDPATTTEINAAKAKLDAIEISSFPASVQESLTAIVNNAKTACEADGILPSQLETIIAEAKANIISTYREAVGLDTEITDETYDNTANFANCSGVNIGVRYDDTGSVLMRGRQAYGSRGKFVNKYAMTNFEMQLQLMDQEVFSALPVTFTAGETNYCSEDNYFHLEFYKIAVDKFLVVFGNTKQHNLSIAGSDWIRETNNTYSGRIITTMSNIFNIKMESDFETHKSTITINNESWEFDTYLICDPTGSGAATAENNPTQDIKATVTFGTMGGTANRDYNLIASIFDAEYETYLEGRDAEVQAVKNAIDQIRTSIPTEELTDETVVAYRAGLEAKVAAATSKGDLTSYDYNKYVGNYADGIVEALNAPVTAYNEKVAAAKADVMTMLDEYVESAYEATEWEQIVAIKDGVEAILAELDIVGEVTAAKAQIKASLDAIMTSAQKAAAEELAAYKETKKTELQTYAALDTIEDSEELRDVAALVSAGKNAIDGCASIEAVDAALTAAKTEIDNKKAEYAAVRALAEAKEEETAKVEEFADGIDYSAYDEEAQTQIRGYVTAALEAIENGETVETVEAVYADMVAKINAVAKKSPEEPAKKGCGGSIVAASVVVSMISLAAAGLVSLKKKED